MRRLALVPVVLVIALVAALPAGASPVRTERTFTLTSETCPNLATGTILEGTGIESSITIERTDASGITTLINATHTHGTTTTDASGITTLINATHTHGTTTDQDGNRYVFNYSNEFRVSNTVADPDTFTGLMTDHFSNSGRGPAKLNNGFVANLTTDFTTFFTFDPISSFGDPLNFADGSAMCDPL